MIVWLLLVALLHHPECHEPSFLFEVYEESITYGWVFADCEVASTVTVWEDGTTEIEMR